MGSTPALDIGGTHATAALVAGGRVVPGTVHRRTLRSDGPADQILEAIAACAEPIADAGPPAARWGIAIPGPFDYERGIGRFEGVAKFESLNGVDIRQVLASRLGIRASDLVFLNDARAFLLGEWVSGAVVGHERVAGITLGTGIGSAFLAGGRMVDTGPTVPPEGRVDLLTIEGRPLEETVSRRAIRRAYLRDQDHPDQAIDVRDIAERARQGDDVAQRVFTVAFTALGTAIGPWLARFGTTALVVGGQISASWDLIEGPLRVGMSRTAAAELVPTRAMHPDEAVLIGAAWHATPLTREG